jgi:hypothetical protein
MIMMGALLLIGGIVGLGVLLRGKRKHSSYRSGAQPPYRSS